MRLPVCSAGRCERHAFVQKPAGRTQLAGGHHVLGERASFACRATTGKSPDPSDDKVRPSHDSLDWGQSIPSYLQSTVATEVCDEWADAISKAEATSVARHRALKDGTNPSEAESNVQSANDLRADNLWERIRQETTKEIQAEPILSSFLYVSILSHSSFAEALAFVLANRIADDTMLPTQLFSLFINLMQAHPEVLSGAMADLEAVFERDPACRSYSQALLYFKGYHGLQLHRMAHVLWRFGRQVMALSLQSRMSEVLAIDIHPAATFGRGILLDHGTGVVIGETAVVANGVSIMQNVTLGGTGKETGDRHPKIRSNVLIGAGASILGNITVGTGAQVAAGSLVLKPVEAHTMVAGTPAKCVGDVKGKNPAASLQQWGVSWKYDPMGSDVLVDAAEAAAVRRTEVGHPVHVYTSEDYTRHVDAEQLMYGGTSDAVPAPGVPAAAAAAAVATGADVLVVASLHSDDDGGETEGTSASEGESQPVARELVDATLSDVEAMRQWGPEVNLAEYSI